MSEPENPIFFMNFLCLRLLYAPAIIQATMKALNIVDDRRCALCGELYRDCDCFEDTAYFFVSSRPDASESGPEKASPTEGHGR